jgi:dipeptide/tripeptide permease
MTAGQRAAADKPSWRYPKEFWLANLMELFERAAYYGFFIMLTVFLTDIVGFNDVWGNSIAGIFMAGVYFLPPFVGAIADRIGFKNGLILAFGLLTIGYFFLGVFTNKPAVLLFLFVSMVGASFIKPLITGTVAKTTDEANRARGYALFYWVVNIGAFSGKTFVPTIREGVGLEYVSFFSAGMSALALVCALFFFKPLKTPEEEHKTLGDVMRSLIRIVLTPRLIILTLIVTGFWLIQHQLYATMPKFVLRMVGEGAKPEWLANVNPFVVVVFVVLITQLMKSRRAVTSMIFGMLLMPFSALSMSFGPWFQARGGDEISVLGLIVLHPFTIAMILGIALQGLAECFISPRFLEYFSLQAPKGEEGAYLGFSHLHSFISAIVGFILSGFLLDSYCPDPKTLPPGLSPAARAAYYADSHHIWYYFAIIGITAALALVVFRTVVNRLDRQRAT